MQSKLTPLMQQYWEIKNQYPTEVVLFRMGDFYEMFHRDAEIAAPIVGIALTQRNKKAQDATKMCGVPHHSIAGPIAKLLAAGHRVAICDQIEDPAMAKGIVKRAVTRVLTPGMVYDPDTLDQLSANYLAAYDSTRVAFADVTTGEAFVYEIASSVEREEILSLLHPVELTLTYEQLFEREREGLHTSALTSQFDGSAEIADKSVERLCGYINKFQGPQVLKTLGEFGVRRRQSCLRLTATTLRHLEILENSRGEREGTLFSAVNRTQTSAGARLLKSWLLHPLTVVDEIRARQSEIRQWLEVSSQLKAFRQKVGELGDVERRVGKVHSSTFNARDLRAIASSVLVGRELHGMHPTPSQPAELAEAVGLAEEIERTLQEELPLNVKEGGLIRKGVRADLDELQNLAQNSHQLLLDLEERERQSTGINSLKVRYNNVFGFYIELTKTHAHKAPEHYRRKQTMVNAERFTTDELDQLEEKILSARSKRDSLEFEIFSGLRDRVVNLAPELLRLSRLWTRWDVLSSLAWLSLERNYVCPEFTASEGAMTLELCRHPVVEQTLGTGFVPNTVRLMGGHCMLLTGPNMAGKSTLMRQVALIAVLAQIGSFVPAQKAVLPVFHEIFTRIGANDALNEGLSTFMVEMAETAQILSRVNRHSLVIMDEVGRGTSTYDGLSLAQAILEYLLKEKCPYLLFATHYFELTQLESRYPQLLTAHMSVLEKGGQIQFLHTLTAGAAQRSYGIHVAKLAGLPSTVTARAEQLLKGFERAPVARAASGSLPEVEAAPIVAVPTPPWVEEIKNLNLSHMTPLEALNKLSKWQHEASS